MIEVVNPEKEMLVRIYRDSLRHYYKSHFLKPDFDVRYKEFGISTDPSRKITQRYVTFNDVKELNSFLRKEAPFFISYSVSNWKYPKESEVELKVHTSSELVFDFDDDEFIEYAKDDIVICGDRVSTVRKILKERRNPLFCEEGEPRIIPIPSEDRWKAVVEKAKELIDILISDFPVDYDDITLNYSGKRGIHVHVKTDLFDTTDHEAVKRMKEEIASYISLTPFNPDGLFETTDSKLIGPTLGINRQVDRILKEIHELLDTSVDRLIALIPNTKDKQTLLKYVSRVGRGKFKEDVKNGFYGPKSLLRAWRTVFTVVARRVGLPIDVQTTTDVNRLIRLPNSIHGTTGLVAKTIDIDNLDDFNPFYDAVALTTKPKVKLKVRYVPQFTFRDTEYGPYENEEVELPFNVAAYLIGVFEGWNCVGGENNG